MQERYRSCAFRARQAGPRDTPFIGDELQLGLVELERRERLRVRVVDGFWNLIHGNSRCVHQRHQVRTLEIEADLAVVAAVHVEQ